MGYGMSVQGIQLGHGLRMVRVARWDILWAVFVALNLAAMRLLPEWQTVPFLAIWVSLTLVYAFRLWRLQPALLTLAVTSLCTRVLPKGEVEQRSASMICAEQPYSWCCCSSLLYTCWLHRPGWSFRACRRMRN